MFSLARLVSGVRTTLQPQIMTTHAAVQQCFYSKNAKTKALKLMEKAKRRRMRINKPDKPAQAKRGARVSKL